LFDAFHANLATGAWMDRATLLRRACRRPRRHSGEVIPAALSRLPAAGWRWHGSDPCRRV